MSGWIARVALALLFVWATGCAATSARTSAIPTWDRPGLAGAVRPEMGSPQPGDIAPDFALPNPAGEIVHLSSFRGSWTLVHFTAAWCPYCDSEVEHLDQIASDHPDPNLKVVLIDVKDPSPVWISYVRAKVSANVISLHDATGAAAARFAPPLAQPDLLDRSQVALDSTLIIDPQGKIRLFLLPDSAHFDPTFVAVRGEIARLRSGVAAGPDGHPALSPKISGHLKPEDVVAVEVVASGCDVIIELRIAPGYHIMSDRPSEPTYIPTRVDLTVDGAMVSPVVYPQPTAYEIDGRSIATFQGDAKIVAPCIRHPSEADSLVEATITYQACTKSTCLFPVHRRVSVRLSLAKSTPEDHALGDRDTERGGRR